MYPALRSRRDAYGPEASGRLIPILERTMHITGHSALIALALAWAGCSHSSTTSRVGLFAHLSVSQPRVVRLDEAEIEAVVLNYGPADATVNAFVLANSVLSVEVLDSGGRVLHPVPPPLPPDDVARFERVLSPGESLDFTYRLSYTVDTPPGEYTVRMKDVPSDQVVLTIR